MREVIMSTSSRKIFEAELQERLQNGEPVLDAYAAMLVEKIDRLAKKWPKQESRLIQIREERRARREMMQR